jgi:hypothetical protein
MAMQSSSPQSLPPNDLVRKVVNHEVRAEEQDHTHWMYQVVAYMPPPSKTTLVVETRSGDLNDLEEIDGLPLTPDQQSAEDLRIQNFVVDTSQQSKARRDSAADDKKSAQLFAMLPDAFIFKYAETTGDNVKLTFQPNPAFSSHSSSSYVFHKMDGFVVLNTKEDRLVEISGRLTKGVKFLGGVMGHLDRGGTFDVRREEVAPSYWTITRLKVNMNGKVLFFQNNQCAARRNSQSFPANTGRNLVYPGGNPHA